MRQRIFPSFQWVTKHEFFHTKNSFKLAIIFSIVFGSFLFIGAEANAATYYVDKRCANNGNGTSAACASAPGGAGAWNSLVEITQTASVPSGSNHTINIATGSGPYSFADVNPTYHYINFLQNSGKTITVNWNGNEYHSDFNVNATAGYEWHQSTATGKTDWYYLTATGSANPALTQIRSAIVNGSWSAESTNLTHGGFTLFGRYNTDNWGWGDYDSLGFSTLYVKTSGNINTIGVWISQVNYCVYQATNKVSLIFNDGKFFGGNGSSGSVAQIYSPAIFNRSLFENADGQCILVKDGSSGSAVYSSIFKNCGHRGVYADDTVASFIVNSNTFINVHLMLLIRENDVSRTVTFKNNSSSNLLAGAIQKDVATPTLTESNNQFYIDPQTTHGGHALAFTTGTRYWTTTGTTDLPASTATTLSTSVDPVIDADGRPTAASPLIDSGTSVGLTTDYTGTNKIYGVPDIGAYEYQPPYTFTTYHIPTTGSARLYSDGKYRMKTASSTTATANFSVTPAEGSYYATTTQYMDITINDWTTTNKEWTATSTAGDFLTHATSTIYTIGDLLPSTYYSFKLDSTASTTAIVDNTQCTAGICKSDADGNLVFTYQGGYSTHTFAFDKDVTGPSAFTLSSPSNNNTTSNTKPLLTWNASSDTESGLAKYQLYLDNTLDTDNLSNITTSVIPTNALSCGSHTWHIRAYDNNGNYTNSDTFNLTMACGGGISLGAYNPPTSPASSVDNPQGGFKVLINNGANSTNNRNVTLTLFSGSDTANMAISEDPSFTNMPLNPFKEQIGWTLSEGEGLKTVYVKFYTLYGQSTAPVSDAITLLGTTPATATTTETAAIPETLTPTETPPVTTPENNQVEVPALPATVSANYTLEQMTVDASVLNTGDVNQVVAQMGIKRDLASELNYKKTIVDKVIKDTGASVQTRNTITNFVTYGTVTTQTLGTGERAGVVNSFKTAFGKLPTTQDDWNDVIKIANGRWLGQTNKTAEERATVNFRKVYLKNPDRKNPHDDAAITVMAYGLRPANRKLESEKAAIKTFKAVYGYNPKTASAWDVVRAIAYSGAKR